MSPTFSYGRGGKLYRYYVSAPLLSNPDHPFVQDHGAGYRAVYDLGEPERSVFIQSTGQSGNPLSVHYDDFAEAWRDGRYLPMLTDRVRVEENALGTLILRPR